MRAAAGTVFTRSFLEQRAIFRALPVGSDRIAVFVQYACAYAKSVIEGGHAGGQLIKIIQELHLFIVYLVIYKIVT